MTKKKTRYKSALLNFFMTVLCLALCGASIWLFYKDLTASSLRSDKNQVATISFKYKIAQRKFNDRVVWERLSQNAPLYNGDTIHTAEMALATINFDNGASVEVSENSMVQIIVGDDGALTLSVNGGSVGVDTTNSSQGIMLDMGNGAIVNMEKNSKMSAALGSEGAAFKVLAGDAVIGDANGNQNAALAAGESVKVSKNGDVVKSPVTVTSVSENQKILLFNGESNSVPLEWFPREGGEKIIVETSAKKDFSVIKNSFAVEDANKVELPASDGILYWRIRTEGDEENTVDGKLNFEKIEPLKMDLPQNKEVFSYYRKRPVINLAWSGNDYAQKYKVEVSKNRNFSELEYESETTSQNVLLGDLPAGEYYWRVTPYYEINSIGYRGTSAAKSFVIERQKEMQPPELTFPPDGNRIAYSSDRFEMDFAWKAEKLESEYTWQIARDRDFKNLIARQTTTAENIHLAFLVSDFPKGEYFWNVAQTYQEESLVSAPRSFYVEEYTPEKNRLLYPDDSYSIEIDKLAAIEFMWKISKENQREYESQKTVLQFSKAEDFSTISLEKETDDIALKNISLGEGKYYWRVVKGKSISDVRAIYIQELLAAPTIFEPADEEKIIFDASKKNTIAVRWDKTRGADFYKLKVVDAETNRTLRELSELTEESAVVPVAPSVKMQKIVIQVQAFANETKLSPVRKSNAAERNVFIKSASPVRLVTPEPRGRLDGLAALKDGVVLNWTKGEDEYASSELYLWRVGAGGNLSLVKEYQNPRESLNIGRLASGNYRWTVKATAPKGEVLDASETREFTVLAVSDLPAPQIREPGRGQKIDAAYLEKNRAINFAWREVSGATDYDFVLYQKLSNGSLKRIYSAQNLKNTQVRIRDLSIFDIGAFQCRVTAKNRARDGFVYQNGISAVQDFRIDFELPGKVSTQDPGDVYGE